MSFAPVIDALALPPDARVDQRVPKKLLLEQGAPTAADKRQIQDGIEELILGGRAQAHQYRRAGLPGRRAGVSGDRGAHRHAALRCEADPPHRTDSSRYSLSPRARRRARRRRQPVAGAQTLVARRDGQGGHRGRAPHGPVSTGYAHGGRSAVPRQPSDLKPAQPRPVCTLSRLARSRGRIGSGPDHRQFAPPDSPDRASALREGLDSHARLQRDIAVLRAQAAKEKQLNRRVQFNLEIKRLETELVEAKKNL